ncbi:MAG: sensor histidine kinase, partial [Ruminococcus sp.]|nr:sensor histidine kinase [Ruminococcus sp.]
EQVKPKAESKKIVIKYTRESHTAKFDSKWTREALFNILDNAVKYSPEKSSIAVDVQMYEMFVCISVSDNGIGIAEDELPRIFGRFYRGQNVREQSGVGIGLYLSRRIIEEQGGYITVESVPGKGSVFRIFLPSYK